MSDRVVTMAKPNRSTLPDVTYLTINDVAGYFNVKRASVYRWIYAGKLAATKLPGRGYRIDEEDVKSLLRAGRSE